MSERGLRILTTLYPFLLGVYPVLFLYSQNPGQATPDLLPLPLALSLCLTLVVLVVARLTTRDVHKASLATAVVLAAFFAYGHLHSAVYLATVNVMAPPRQIPTQARYEYYLQWTLACAVLLLLRRLLRGISRIRAEVLPEASKAATATVLVLLVLVGITGLGHRASATTTQSGPAERVPVSGASTDPDIYHIVLDGYGRKDVLERHFGLDNSPFLNALEAEGFEVASRSTANYYWTHASLPSMLNMRYLGDVAARQGPSTNDLTAFFSMIRESEVTHFLRRRGYRIVHLDSTWPGTMGNERADVLIACASGWFQINFYRALVESSALRILQSPITNDLARCHLEQFNSLERAAALPGPKYVFAHFIPPHHPYVFDRHGNVLREATTVDQFEFNLHLWSRRDLYRDQLLFINDRLLRALRTIIATNKGAPVIVLHSDHGPQLVDANGYPEPGDAEARFGNLFALRTNAARGVTPSDVTLVNAYRIIFNHYFDAKLPTLPAEHYHSPFDRPYDLRRVHLTASAN